MKREGLRHPKTLDLMARLSINRREAIGLLDLLLDWAIDYAPCGDVGKWSNGVIAGAVDWTGDADDLVAALVGSGWLDENPTHRLIVHDWPHHAPNFLRAKLKKLHLSFLDCYSHPERTEEASDESEDDSVEGDTNPCSSPPLPANQAPAAACSSQTNGTAAAAAEISQEEFEKAKPVAKLFRSAVYPSRPNLMANEWLWLARVGVLGNRYGPVWYEPALEALKRPGVNSPMSLAITILDDECQRLGTRLTRELAMVKIPVEFLPNPKQKATSAHTNTSEPPHA